MVGKHIYCAATGNLNTTPGLVENQIVGAAVEMTSRTLSRLVTYPILRFKDSPDVTPIAVQRPGRPPIGVGEPVSESIPAAIANAFSDAGRAHAGDAADARPCPSGAGGGRHGGRVTRAGGMSQAARRPRLRGR